MMRTLKFITLLLVVTSASAFAGGDHDGGDDHGHAHDNGERPTVAVTQWTDQMELFMEYPMMVSSEPGRFIIHLTILDGFQPVREGRVRLSFTNDAGVSETFEEDQLLREGIFAPTITIAAPGPRQFTLNYESEDISDSFVIEDFKVYAGTEYLPHSHEEESESITFLKEQQWRIPFATAAAEVREVKQSIWAVGHVLPSPESYVEVFSPVNGVVQVKNGDKPALPGTSVGRGDVVAIIRPTLQGDGWASAHLAYEQAKRDYERARRLKDQQAIPTREYESIANEYHALKVGYEALSGGGSAEALELHAPLNGRIIEWDLKPGQRVSVGDKLMAIADPRTVWLRVNVFDQDYGELGTPVGALVKTRTGRMIIGETDLRLLSSGGALDPITRAVPVLLQVENPDGALKINETVPVELYTSEGSNAPTIPLSSVFEDEGLHVVYVQREGEAFEKRIVQTGPRYEDWITVLDGIDVGERVVTTGGYHVKLASTSAEIGHGHAH